MDCFAASPPLPRAPVGLSRCFSGVPGQVLGQARGPPRLRFFRDRSAPTAGPRHRVTAEAIPRRLESAQAQGWAQAQGLPAPRLQARGCLGSQLPVQALEPPGKRAESALLVLRFPRPVRPLAAQSRQPEVHLRARLLFGLHVHRVRGVDGDGPSALDHYLRPAVHLRVLK